MPGGLSEDQLRTPRRGAPGEQGRKLPEEGRQRRKCTDRLVPDPSQVTWLGTPPKRLCQFSPIHSGLATPPRAAVRPTQNARKKKKTCKFNQIQDNATGLPEKLVGPSPIVSVQIGPKLRCYTKTFMIVDKVLQSGEVARVKATIKLTWDQPGCYVPGM